MTTTRSSTRKTDDSNSHKNGDATAGTKRKPEVEPSTQPSTKKQVTLEETIGSEHEDSEMKDATSEHDGQDKDGESGKQSDGENIDVKDDSRKVKKTSSSTKAKHESAEKEAPSASNGRGEDERKTETKRSHSSREGAVEESSQRRKQVPSNILEKGVIYFFTRNRVGIDDAESVGDLQRTFFVLRPLPAGARLGDGVIQDLKNNRLFALPKKTFPKSHSDRFMAFVEKANTTIQDLKDNFFAGTEYETKTQGTRKMDPVTPIAEGIYAITRTDDATTHLAYSTTIPSKLGEIQEDLGIRDQGSFIISVKNPERSGPAAAQLPQKPDFPKEIIEEFRGLAWTEVKPKYIDYEYCQMLLIGENIDKAMEPTKKDQKHDKETPLEEFEKLEHEDELRVQHLHGNDSIFDDLQISKKEYPQVPTTW